MSIAASVALAFSTLSAGAAPAASVSNPATVVSGDPGVIYYNDTRGGLWSISGDGTGQRLLVGPEGLNSFPSVSADGRLVLYTERSASPYAIHLMEADGSNNRVIGRTWSWSASLSPDGNRYAVSEWVRAYGDYPAHLAVQVFAVSGELISSTALPSVPYDIVPSLIRWSPDGTQLLMPVSRSEPVDSLEIMKIAADGSSASALPLGSAFAEDDAVWSHDGTQIVTSRNPRNRDHAYPWVHRADGTSIGWLTTPSAEVDYPSLAFSPDDSKILLGPNIRYFDRTTGSIVDLNPGGSFMGCPVWAKTPPSAPATTRTAVSTLLTEEALTTQVTVTRGVPGARITITDGTTVIRRPLLGARGTAKVNLTLPAGRHTLRASYPGTTTTKPSVSTAKTVTTY